MQCANGLQISVKQWREKPVARAQGDLKRCSCCPGPCVVQLLLDLRKQENELLESRLHVKVIVWTSLLAVCHRDVWDELLRSRVRA